MNVKTAFAIGGFLFCSAFGKGQDTIRVSLYEAIRRAASQSVDAVVARNEYVSGYWEYRTWQTELLPEILFKGTLPYYSRSYNTYQDAGGAYSYVSNDYSRIDAGLSVTQNIPWTGGKLSFETYMQRLEQYADQPTAHYKTIPVSLTLEQPVFGFNTLKWKQRIEPVKKKESEQKLAADVEAISNTTVTHYFNLLLAKANLDIARQNLENTQKLYAIAQARRKIGQISENELLQLSISLLNAEAAIIHARSSADAQMFQLCSFLGYGETLVIEPALPVFVTADVPALSYPQVQSRAIANNAFTQSVRRRILEASRDVDQAKAGRWGFTLFASVGMSGQDEKFYRSLHQDNLRANQIAEVGLSIPILDWGKRKGQVKIVEARRETVLSEMEKEQRDFNRNLFLIVQNFNNQPRQLDIARETDRIAQQRYQTSVEAFVLGKTDVLNLNDAQSSKDVARRNYVEQMYLLWTYYYQIRSLALYDYVLDKELTVNYADYRNR